ncbi:hypothetical protein DPMN_092595 [Dreissena polymorpha]|uniref:Uncharacterized protein n=1 Tax=Dreissena polymorpha TaxID=45954 RepID=A0A9D4L2Q4_DREPO|nr:hypothetical protein DPMN_092595 [Dreissena polymorpha]
MEPEGSRAATVDYGTLKAERTSTKSTSKGSSDLQRKQQQPSIRRFSRKSLTKT